MKKLTLISMSILLITIVACKKTTTNPQRTNNTIQSTDYSGTYVNPNDNTDYIKLSVTTNDKQGNKRYHVDYFLYNHCSACNSGTGLNEDTVLESNLITTPGWFIESNNSNSPNNPNIGYVLYTNNSIKFDLHDGVTNSIIKQTTYNKQ